MSKRNPYLVIYGISHKTHLEISNIADNLGMKVCDFMKPELRKICDSYPEHMKIPFKKILVNEDASVREKAIAIAEMCMPCSKDVYGKIFRNAIEVLGK